MGCPGCVALKCRGKWFIATAVVMIAAIALGHYWFTLGQPNAIQPDEEFELQFGRGSGWHGLDLLRITSDGNAVYEYQAERDIWKRKSFVVNEATLVALRKTINDLNIWGMDHHDDGSTNDGTQWCLLIRIDGKSKAFYFDNHFPNRIRQLADFVDQAILEPFAVPVVAEVVPARHHRKHEKELWQSVRSR